MHVDEIVKNLTLERVLEDIELAKQDFERYLRYSVYPSYEIHELDNYLKMLGMKVRFEDSKVGEVEYMYIDFNSKVDYSKLKV